MNQRRASTGFGRSGGGGQQEAADSGIMRFPLNSGQAGAVCTRGGRGGDTVGPLRPPPDFVGSSGGKHEENTKRIRREYEGNTKGIRGPHASPPQPPGLPRAFPSIVPNPTLGHSSAPQEYVLPLSDSVINARSRLAPECSRITCTPGNYNTLTYNHGTLQDL
jgi:hypothetical protein